MIDNRIELLKKLVLGLKAHIYYLEYANMKRISVDNFGNNIKFTFIVNDKSNNFHDGIVKTKSPKNIQYKQKDLVGNQQNLINKKF